MPNENAPACGCDVVVDLPKVNQSVCRCGVVVDLPKSRNGTRKLTILIPKSKGGKSDGRGAKKEDGRGPKNRSFDTGGSSSVADQSKATTKSGKHEKRLNHTRRTRSADRATENHYTYIDSISSILGGGIRENTIPEALYATIPDTPNASANETGSNQPNAHNRSQPVYAIPSMTSPPPTYDVAIAKTWQSGLPPTYEEYLCHKYAMISRSHTPPPPWSDSSTATTTPSAQQSRRELLSSQPELREYLAQLALAQGGEQAGHYQHHHHHQSNSSRESGYLSSQQILREQQARTQQRARAMPPRSQSETRAQQQRIATMYEDGAFCMETTALQSAFENGVAFCSLM